MVNQVSALPAHVLCLLPTNTSAVGFSLPKKRLGEGNLKMAHVNMHSGGVLKHTRRWSFVLQNSLHHRESKILLSGCTGLIAEWMTALASRAASSPRERKRWRKIKICSWNVAAPNSSEAESRSTHEGQRHRSGPAKIQVAPGARRVAQRKHSAATRIIQHKRYFSKM